MKKTDKGLQRKISLQPLARHKKPSFIKAQFLLQCSFRGTGAHRQTRHK